MSDNEYPNLGFNPVPGMPDAVESLQGKVSSVVDAMSQANTLMGRLRNANDTVWQGPAGDAFREHFNTKLVEELDHAHQSLSKATEVIRGWHGDLVNFKDTANKLEAEAARAREEQTKAETALQQAKSNPDLRLANRIFTDEAALREAQSRLDAAESALRGASERAQSAADKLEDIIRRARELQAQHEDVARKAAQALNAAAERFAPHKPGLLSRMIDSFTSALKAVGDWVKDHLKDIHPVLSTISAIAGLLALVTPPPADAIALGISVAAGAGALATDIADPEFRHGIGELLHGRFNKESLGALMTGVADVASVIPGVSVGAKAIKGAEGVVEGVEGASNISRLASVAAKKPGLMVKALGRVPGVAKLGESATFADNVLEKAFRGLDPAKEVKALDRLNLFWRARGVASNLYHDVKQATS